MTENNKIDQMNDEIKEVVHVEVIMTQKVLFHFLLMNTWMSFGGKLRWLVSLIAIVYLPFAFTTNDLKTAILLVIIVGLNLVVFPVTIHLNSKKQIESNEAFKYPLEYTVQKEGLNVKQSVGEGMVTWTQIKKVVETRKLVLFYINANQAFILPKENMRYVDDLKILRKIVESQKEFVKSKFKRS